MSLDQIWLVLDCQSDTDEESTHTSQHDAALHAEELNKAHVTHERFFVREYLAEWTVSIAEQPKRDAFAAAALCNWVAFLQFHYLARAGGLVGRQNDAQAVHRVVPVFGQVEVLANGLEQIGLFDNSVHISQIKADLEVGGVHVAHVAQISATHIAIPHVHVALIWHISVVIISVNWSIWVTLQRLS